jgi:hypothetical protein
MDGDTLSELIDELNGGGTIGETLKFQLVNIAKGIFEQVRPWVILRYTDTSKTVTTANTWQTAIDLSAVARFSRFFEDDQSAPVKVFDGIQNYYEYRQVPWNQRLRYINEPGTFVYDEANKNLYLNGSVTLAGTLYIDHLKFSADLTASSTATAWPFPSWSHAILALMAVGIHKGGVDFDDINTRMAPENEALAQTILSRLESWDTEKQLAAITRTDPSRGSGSGYRSGAISIE